ncbi:MAG: BlaI/MecI/CopY family transcriptional regulator [Myxococcota bacterium]
MAKTTPSRLGELEIAVMEHVWEHGPTDVRAAHAVIGADRGITHNTVQSTFKRLADKGLLRREKRSHAYVYSALVDRRALTERVVGEMVDQVSGGRVEIALEAFVDFADHAGEDTLDRLERLIAARRAEEES